MNFDETNGFWFSCPMCGEDVEEGTDCPCPEAVMFRQRFAPLVWVNTQTEQASADRWAALAQARLGELPPVGSPDPF